MLEYLRCVIFGLDLFGGDDALDDALGRDDEGRAEGAHILAAIHRFLAPDTELFDETVVGVADEGEGQGVLLDEALVRGGTVDVDAYDLDAFVEQLAVVVAEVAGLGGAARCRVFGVEIKRHGFVFVVAESDFFAVGVCAEEVVDFIACVHIYKFDC